MRKETIYDELGVPRVINAAGTKTRIGGTRMRQEAVEAMERASTAFVRLSDLQARASERIAEVTGAQAGYVTSGAAAGLMLGTAAVLAGTDVRKMNQLPDTDGIADEILVPRTHRTGYDHAFRAAGATIVDVGTNDRHLGTGSRNVEPWEIERRISERTAAIGYVQKPHTGPPLSVVTEIAHEHGLPVIVDAAAELPPTDNLSAFVDDGADLVAFSGGKAIRGPQTTGILAGRRELIESVALQHLDTHAAGEIWDPPEELVDLDRVDGVPRQGIGRPSKVGKEELVGLIAALDAFLDEDQAARRAEWYDKAERAAAQLERIEGLKPIPDAADDTVPPRVVVSVDPATAGADAAAVARTLRAESPRVFVGADRLDEGMFTVDPTCLTDVELEYVIERIEATVSPP